MNFGLYEVLLQFSSLDTKSYFTYIIIYTLLF